MTLQETRLREVLFNLSPESGATAEYCRGLMVGVVSTLIATNGDSYAKAIRKASNLAPITVIADCVPDSWKTDFSCSNNFRLTEKGKEIWVRGDGI